MSFKVNVCMTGTSYDGGMTTTTISRNPGTRYLRPQGGGDTYDAFKGVGLSGTGAGRFEDEFQTSDSTQIETTRQAAARVKKQLAATRKFRNIEVGPEATRTVEKQRQETFKGVTLFNRWRIGRYEVSESSKETVSYDVSAELPVGGGTATTKMKVGESQSDQSKSQGWYFFD